MKLFRKTLIDEINLILENDIKFKVIGDKTKLDILTRKKIDDLETGIGWDTWDWNEKGKEIGADAEPTEGVLAQEVLEVKPDAVVVKDGYYAVDYSKVL